MIVSNTRHCPQTVNSEHITVKMEQGVDDQLEETQRAAAREVRETCFTLSKKAWSSKVLRYLQDSSSEFVSQVSETVFP